MEIQKKGRSKGAKPTSSSSLFDDDFASGFEDGKFEKFKPLFKVFVVLIILVGIGYGAYAYLGNKKENATRTADTTQPSSGEMSQLEQCVDEAWNNHKTPEESDPDFYPKLIAGYDAQLACYDTYPDENSATNRLSIESARKSAIDSSSDYKDIYLSTNPYEYEYKPSSTGDTSQYNSSSRSSSSVGSSSSSQPSSSSDGSSSSPSEWELNKAEFDAAIACADSAAASVLIQGAYGSPSYYQQKIEQLETQLTCTNNAKYSMTQQRRSWYQSQIATNKARYNDSINPNSPSYYPNAH